MQETIRDFLETELSDQEYYDGIIRFIYLENIRCGEYECNQFVVKKMDMQNYIIFEEFIIDEKREIQRSFSISKRQLLKTINQYASKNGLEIRSFDWA